MEGFFFTRIYTNIVLHDRVSAIEFVEKGTSQMSVPKETMSTDHREKTERAVLRMKVSFGISRLIVLRCRNNLRDIAGLPPLDEAQEREKLINEIEQYVFEELLPRYKKTSL